MKKEEVQGVIINLNFIIRDDEERNSFIKHIDEIQDLISNENYMEIFK
jgi:hypothetical protein